MKVRTVEDPDELVPLFAAHPITHLYGLPDLEEPFWSNSRWFRSGDAAVGIVSDGQGSLFGYAMSAIAAGETIALLAGLVSELEPGSWVTGPLGLAEGIGPVRPIDAKGPHQRMVLREDADLPPPTGTSPLTTDDLPAIGQLMSNDPTSAFYREPMVAQGTWHGIWESGQLVACAGTHVVSDRFGVAAIGGVMTHPDHRGRGLGTAVTGAVCHGLIGRVGLIGLNVDQANRAAVRVYRRLGFRPAMTYEEIEVL